MQLCVKTLARGYAPYLVGVEVRADDYAFLEIRSKQNKPRPEIYLRMWVENGNRQ